MSETGHARTIAYRRDIDGLRAVAVVAVTLFHLGFHSLEGGFLGVDVFFVISGFLITAIIEKRTGNGKLSFKDFYFGRIRRLLPAMLVTVAATLIGAAIIMTPDDLIAFAGSAIGAILSVSNFVFYFESGYWDTASELKPLLHTWSLGVEEQFYLFWPALLLLVFVNFAKRAGLIFALISAAGLALSEYMRATDPSAAFYLFPFRIFEFSLGALVIYIGRGGLWSSLSRFAVIRDGVGIVGLGIICASVWFYKGSTPFPGIYALPPVLGTMMVILAGCGDRGTGPVSRAVLSNPVSNWLGQVSYSMYLAHWPIIVLYRYETGLELELAEQAGLAVAILIATILLHYGVERRFRYKAPDPSTGTTSLNPTGFALATLAAGYSLTLVHGHILVDRGWAWRMPDIQLTPDMIAEGMDARFNRTNAGCRIDQIGVKPGCDLDRETNILVFGNSHEPDGFNFLTAGFEAQPELGFFHFGTINQCAPTRETDGSWVSRNGGCRARMDALFDEETLKGIDTLVYAANIPFGANKTAFAGMMEDLKAIHPDLRIMVFGGYINTKIPCSRLLNEAGDIGACKQADNVRYFEADPEAGETYERIMAIADGYIDRVALLCEDRSLETCRVSTARNVPLMYDEHHLSLEFAEETGREYAAAFPDLFSSAPSPGIRPTRADQVVRQAPQSGPIDFAFPLEEVQASPFVSSRLENGVLMLERATFGELLPGGKTNGVGFEIAPGWEDAVSGELVTIVVEGSAPSPTTLKVAYSTNEVGNSGWMDRIVDGTFSETFTYRVPQLVNGRGDYIGIAPDSGRLEITAIRLLTGNDG